MCDEHASSTALAFFYDFEPPLGDFRADILEGLGRTPKATSPKYFYDERGSALFDQICDVPEYYVTGTELRLLRTVAPEIAKAVGPDAAVIELGAGSAVKIRILLDALVDPAIFVAQDISRDHLLAAAETIAADYPDLNVGALVSDFTQPAPIEDAVFQGSAARVVFFPGSTIGNFSPVEARDIWRATRKLLRNGDWFVLGVDLVKDETVLLNAYDDAGGVTSKFNLNLLHRINAELDGDIAVDQFRHRATWNDDKSRIEMHLESTVDQTFHVSGQAFSMSAGETIHTENSYKYTVERIAQEARAAGFAVEQTWVDEAYPFGVFLLRAV